VQQRLLWRAWRLQVAFTRRGITASAAAALEQACKQQQQQSLGFTDITPYAALSSTARAACAAAIQQELQLLGANEQTLADDLAVLQAVQQLPVQQQEWEGLQGQLQQKQEELQQLQLQLEQQQEAAPHEALADGSDATPEGGEDLQTALGREVTRVAAVVDDLQQQVTSLQQLLAEWHELVSGKKLLAVQFRLEKQQLLDGLLAQLG
jgi:type V secretory pathway adhesin AidA